jgi:hypothetical protein
MTEDPPGEEQSEEVKERLSRRFGDEGEDDSDTDMNANTDTTAESAERAKNAWNAESVKDAWRGMTVYLPEDLRDHLDDEYRRVDFELSGEVDGEQLRKDRHYKPLLIALGLERMEDMKEDELTAFIERMQCGEFSEE